MDFRTKLISLVTCMALLIVVGAGACTDTPGLTENDNDGPGPGDCSEGEIYDEINEECVEDDNGVNQNNDEPDPADELDPWEDESGDGVPNKYDNCPFHYNPDQTDTAGDGVGDVCDNCPHLANPDQEYSDDNPVDDRGIIMGDACVPGGEDNPYADTVTDSSGDGVPDIMDNCPDHYNPPLEDGCSCPVDDVYCAECLCTCPDGEYPCADCAQLDSSGDGVGDKCDNCPYTHNPNQTSTPGNPTWDQFYDAGDCDNRDCSMRVGDACAPTPGDISICDSQETEFERMKPNVYISFDLSGSMGTTRMEQAKSGLDTIAEDLYDEIRFGLGTYPHPTNGGCTIGHILDVDSYTDTFLKNTWGSYSSLGCTPMLDSMADIENNNRLNDPGDPNDANRVKAVLLITDGVPNCGGTGTCGTSAGQVDAVEAVIEDLYAENVLTFVVGFQIDHPSLVTFAEAGGTDDPFLASNADDLSNAMADVADLLVSCDYTLETPPEDPNKLWIKIDGTYLDPSEYSYNAGDNILTLEQNACDSVQSIDSDQIDIEIEMGCASQCVEEEPDGLCDMWYETCGQDYPCDTCEPEICDGTDNNCSGTIDENCPDCGIYQASCESTADCCEPFVCRDGVCDHECYPDGVSCTSDGQCCSGLCGISSGEDIGSCISP